MSECDGRSDAARCGGASTNAASLADSIIIDKLASSSRFQRLTTMPHRSVTPQRVGGGTIDIEKDLARLPVSAPSTFEQSPENSFEATPSPNRDAEMGESSEYAPDPERTVEVDCPVALFALVSARERPRLAPQVQPYNLEWRKRIERLKTTRGVKIGEQILGS